MDVLTRVRTLSLLLALSALAGGAAAQSLETAVKAAFLYKFALYVEWPQSAFSAPDSALRLCVAGDDPFGNALDDAARGQRVGGRAIAVQRLRGAALDGCHILFVGDGAGGTAQTLAGVRGKPVLTVTDSRDTATGVINFVVRDNRVRFTIDDAAAAANGLVISSKLLSLALDVKLRAAGDSRGER